MRVRALLQVCLLAALIGCGGGTSGTSPTGGGPLNKVFSGVVIGEDGTPEPNVEVTSDASERSTVTDSEGRFSLDAGVSGSAAELYFRGERESADVPLNGLAAESSVVGLQVRLGDETRIESNIELVVLGIGGDRCSGLFSPPSILRFTGTTPPLVIISQVAQPAAAAVECTALIRINSNGEPGAGKGFQLLFVSSSPQGSGTLQSIDVVSQGETDAAGSGTLSFTLSGENTASGFYIIEAPLDLPGGKRVGVVISLLNEVQ